MPPQGISGEVWWGNAPPVKPRTLKKGDEENWQGEGDPVNRGVWNFSGSRWGVPPSLVGNYMWAGCWFAPQP